MTGIGIGIGLGFPNPRRGMIAPGVLSAYVSAVAGAKLTALVVGDDFPDNGATWPARNGSALSPFSTGRPSIGAINGRRAPLFAVNAAAQSYVLPVNQAEYWAVARWDGALPFAANSGIVGGPGAVSARLLANTGTSSLVSSGTITRDGAASLVCDASTHVWRSVGTPGADDKQVGAYYTGANNWIGPIGLVMAFNAALTADEASQILTLVNRYFKI